MMLSGGRRPGNRCFVCLLLFFIGLFRRAETSVTAAAANQLQQLKAALLRTKDSNATLALTSWIADTNPCSPVWDHIICLGGQVQGIDLAESGLLGTLPSEFGDVPGLEQLLLEGNLFTGAIPEEWAHLWDLTTLNLNDNSLSGTLPASWGSFSSIRTLSLKNNHLYGTLPLSWGGLSHAILIDISGNQISGSLPASWAELTYLSSLFISGNKLTGTLPIEWGDLSHLLILDVGSNLLNGTLPGSWSGMKPLRQLSLSNNTLQGQLPPEWSSWSSIQQIMLTDNDLSGIIPAQLSTLADTLFQFDVSGNAGMCGKIPPRLIGAAWNTSGTNLGQDCGWTRDAAALIALRDAVVAVGGSEGPALDTWLDNSNPCGVPEWPGVECNTDHAVTGVTLSRQNLEGTLPPGLAAVTSLNTIDLSENHFSGNLPPEWGSQLSLQVIDLTNNMVEGSLPDSWASLKNLTELLLGSNNLNGTLPNDWAAMQSLQTLDISVNSLAGGLPDGWSILPTRVIHLDRNLLAGTLPVTWEAMPTLQQLYLDDNELTGQIPSGYSRIPNLRFLSLSKNARLCGDELTVSPNVLLDTGRTSVGVSCASIGADVASVTIIVVLGCLLAISVSSTIGMYVHSRHRLRSMSGRSVQLTEAGPRPYQLARGEESQPGTPRQGMAGFFGSGPFGSAPSQTGTAPSGISVTVLGGPSVDQRSHLFNALAAAGSVPGSGNFAREMSNTELIAHSVKSATSSGASKPTVPAARSASATLGEGSPAKHPLMKSPLRKPGTERSDA